MAYLLVHSGANSPTTSMLWICSGLCCRSRCPGEPGERFRDDRHVYANDLDLFGTGSLFELLSLARTYTGEETLARWLTTAADAPELRARQEAVRELGPALDLREHLAIAGTEIRESVRTGRLFNGHAAGDSP